jgi:hypothetical protein
MPFLLSTFTEAAFSSASENILALMSVVMASSLGVTCLLHDTTINAASMAATKPDLLPDMFFLPNPKTILREAKTECKSVAL